MVKKIGAGKADTLVGTGAADILLGLGGNDVLSGGAGNDLLDGGTGADKLDGGTGKDTLLGGSGNDRLTGGLGNDTINGGTGSDTAVFSGKSTSYSVTKSGSSWIVKGPDGTDRLSGVEFLKFSDKTINLAVNAAPTVTVASTLAATEDVSKTFAVSAYDINGVTVKASAANGTVVNNKNGTFTYTGDADFSGADTITITATDSLGKVTTKTVAVTVAAVADAPVASDDIGNTDANVVLNGSTLLVNDTDADGDTLVVSKVEGQAGVVGSTITLGSGALLKINSDGTYVYNPNGKFDSVPDGTVTSDSFTYEISDGNGGTSTATVTVVINGTAPITGKTFTLTNSIDQGASFLGTAQDDSYAGGVILGGAPGSSTFTAGDNLDGGAGTGDAVSLLISGNAFETISGQKLSNIENVDITNVATSNSEIDATLWTGVQAVSLAGSASGDTQINNLKNIVSATISSGADLALFYDAAVVAGAADAHGLTLKGSSGGSFATNGIETLNINSSTADNDIQLGAGFASVVITGDKNLALGVNGNGVNINASGLTAGKLSASGIFVGGDDAAIVGSGQDDTLSIEDLQFVDLDDSINGGGGTDTIVSTNNATLADIDFTKVVSVEAIQVQPFSGSSVNLTLGALALASGLKTVIGGDQNDATTVQAAFTGPLTVVGVDGDDTVIAAASASTITVTGKAGDFTAGDILTGGTGTSDKLEIQADNATADMDNVSGFETVTVLAGAIPTADVTIALNVNTVVAAGKSLTVDASALTNAAASLTFDGTAENDKLTVIGGVGADFIETGTGNDSVVGGAGNDTINTSTGNDSVDGGDGDDTIQFVSTNLTAADSVKGGEGAETKGDTLQILDAAAVSDAALQLVSEIEILAGTDGVGLTATLAANALAQGINRVDGTNSADVITIDKAYTGSLTVELGGGGNDTIAAAVDSPATLAVLANESEIDGGDTLTGGTGKNDTLKITADAGSAVLGANFTKFEAIDIVASSGKNQSVSITTHDANVGAGETLTINAAALTTASETFTFDGKTETNGKFVVLGGTGVNTITGGAGDDTITGGAGNDALAGGTGNDSISGAGGDDVITFSTAQLDGSDTVDGGANTDTLSITDSGAVVDADFTKVTSVERLSQATSSTALTTTLGGAALAAGITTLIGNGTANDVVTILAGFTGPVSVTTAQGVDTVDASASTANLTIVSNVADLTAADTLKGGSDGGDVLSVKADGGASNLSGVTGFETITVNAGTVGSEDATITIGADAFVPNGGTVTVNASALTNASADFSFDASAETGTGKFIVTGATAGVNILTGGSGDDSLTGGSGVNTLAGGGGSDTLIGGASNDTLTGGAGADTITGSGGNDSISGGTGNDTINAGSGADDVVVVDINSNGADTITLGTDADIDEVFFVLRGGSGGTATGVSTITDFDAGTGLTTEDIISITTATAPGGAGEARQSGGSGNNVDLVVLDNQVFVSLSDAAAAADNINLSNAVNGYIFVWQDNTNLVHVSSATVDAPGDLGQDQFVDLVTLQGASISSLTLNDFIIA